MTGLGFGEAEKKDVMDDLDLGPGEPLIEALMCEYELRRF